MGKKVIVIGTFIALLAASALLAAGQKETDYWSHIKQHLRAADKAASRQSPEVQAAYAYLESLSGQELIIAGRQAGREMGKYQPDDWPVASMNLSWFYQHYPQKTDNLSDIGPLLDEIQNRDRPAYWRWYLERLLTDEWAREGRLSDEQRRRVSEALLGVLQQKEEHPAVAAQAARGVPRLLAGLKEGLPPLGEDAQPGTARRELASLSRRYAELAGSVLERREAPTELHEAVLAGLVRVGRASLPGAEITREAVERAARNYASYPEKLWPRIMLSAFEAQAEVRLAALLDEAERGAETEQVADHLRAVRERVKADREKWPREALGFRLDAELAEANYAATGPVLARVQITNTTDSDNVLVLQDHPMWKVQGEDQLGIAVRRTRYARFIQEGLPTRPRQGHHGGPVRADHKVTRYIALNRVADLTVKGTYSVRLGLGIISDHGEPATIWSQPLDFSVAPWSEAVLRARLEFAGHDPTPEQVAGRARLARQEVEELIDYAGPSSSDAARARGPRRTARATRDNGQSAEGNRAGWVRTGLCRVGRPRLSRGGFRRAGRARTGGSARRS